MSVPTGLPEDYTYLSDSFKASEAFRAGGGGLILGVSVSLLYICYGNLTGISGMVEKVFQGNQKKEDRWQLHYLCGLYVASYLYNIGRDNHTLTTMALPSWMYVVAGVLVGMGSRVGCGCTSGHGISGLARLSPRSIVAVGSFFVMGVTVANLVHGVAPEKNGAWKADIKDLNWYKADTISGTTLAVLSFIPVLQDIEFKTCIVWACGGLFGLGLAMSGMTNNGVVLSFLNFNKMWNPALMFVLAFAVMSFGLTFWLREHWKSKPLYADEVSLPKNKTIDAKLVIGEIMFGAGWGLAGLCPGPVVAVLSVPAVGAMFVPAMWIGIKAADAIKRASDSTSDSNSEKIVSAPLANA